ncbi:Unknown protein [Striga hermonthica]|uniref:Protein FAR1-RELATED SEQUENCE n=1 Tax=Striga hermonthica TaxID=68872 RepID=A0A9N7N4R6_STRHE|nr:Unknown protein [Striga hermonthica]
MTFCDSEDEFEATWKVMIDQHNLGDDRWFKVMYKLRKGWATAFSNDKFCAGLLATSRSEVTNRVLKDMGNKALTLHQFVLNYEKVQDKWRSVEKDDDAHCSHGRPGQIVKNNPLLPHAAEVYTFSIYKLFEREFVESLNVVLIDQNDFGNGWLGFKMRSHNDNSKVRQVFFKKYDIEVKCSCHLFETMGILCRHALKVFISMNIISLPEPYIMSRWSRKAEQRVCSEFERTCTPHGTSDVSQLTFVNHAMRSSYDLVHLSKSHKETRSRLNEILEKASEEITCLLKNLDMDDSCDELVDENSVRVRNPPSAKTRGVTNAQITRHWDKSKKTKRGKEKVGNSSKSRKKTQMGGNTNINLGGPTQSSQNDVNPEEANNVPYYPSQSSMFWPNINQWGGNTNINLGGPAQSSQNDDNTEEGGNTNINLGAPFNLFGYQLDPFSSQRPSNN